MSKRSINQPLPLEALFNFAAAPDDVKLFHGEITLSGGGQSYTTTVDTILKFIPTPSVVMRAELAVLDIPIELRNLLSNVSNEITYEINGIKIEGFVKSFNFFSGELYLMPCKQPVQVLGDMQAQSTVASVFHLFNFPGFSGKNVLSVPAPEGCRHLILQNDQWQITIQSLPSTKKAEKRIKKEGGIFLTHMGKLERIDGKRFSGDEAEEQYRLIYRFLSFAIGSQCRPVCRVGLDENGTRMWEDWDSPVSSHSATSWFNPNYSHQIEKLFPLFSQKWQQSSEWEDCLHSSIYWYIQSNMGGKITGIDTAIILAQSALERLAYHYLVIDQKMISDQGFNKLWVSDQFRLLLSSLKIPIEITDEMPEIRKVQAHLKWKDAPHALTDIRNSLIHPVSKNKEKIAHCYVDAWRFSLWYIELIILALCGYEGSYRNRLKNNWAGDVDDVPWNKV